MGKITKRKDGRYQIAIYIGTFNGKEKYKYVYGKTQKEVKAKELDVKIKLGQGADILIGDRKTFEYWCNLWLEQKDRKLNQTDTGWLSTIKSRAKIMNNYLGNMDIDEIKAIDCERFLQNIALDSPFKNHKPLSAKTVKEYRSQLISIFEFCIDNRVLTFNPAKHTEKPIVKKETEYRDALTNEQIKYFVDTAHPVMQRFAMIGIYAGLRRGEILALTWNDIDLINKTITVNKSMSLRMHNMIKLPKTDAGNRIVPITDILYNYLIEQKQDALLVVHKDGHSMTESQYQTQFNHYIAEIKNKYGVDFEVSAHYFRHTYITLLFEAGVDPLQTKDIVGHKSIDTTLKIYSHLRESHKNKTIDLLNKYLSLA